MDRGGFLYALSFEDNHVYQHLGGSSWYAVGQFQPDRRLNGGGYLYALNLDDHKVYEHVGWDQWAVRPRQRLPDRGEPGGLPVRPEPGRRPALRALGGVRWSVNGGNVYQIAVNQSGDLYALNSVDHQVYEHVGGSSWSVVGGGVGQIGTDKGGYLYALNTLNQQVYERTRGGQLGCPSAGIPGSSPSTVGATCSP